jgi:23S rRNA (cytosine1962-C5)-methyltransferase
VGRVRSPSIVLKPGRERSLLRRHPWIFSGAVASVERNPQPGETVAVRTAGGDVVAQAAFSAASQIRARVWSLDPADVIDDAFVARRVVTSAQRRAGLLDAHTDSARLVFSEADGVPGLVADRYGDVVVCQITSAGAERWREACADALGSLTGVTSVFERSDAEMREREDIPMRVGAMRGPEPPRELVAHERAWNFAVDVAEGHKTGFYLDQRDARDAVARIAVGRRMLNVFSYTGAFGIVAATQGATSVTSIDSSGPALAIARRNAQLNFVDVGEVIEGDAFTVLRGLRDRARQYDLVVLDPPKLAASAKHLDKASRAYKDLNLLAIKLLAPGGVLLTFSCSAAMTGDLFRKVVADAALDARRTVRVVGALRQAGDHPVPLSFPEAEYLKGLVLEAE